MSSIDELKWTFLTGLIMDIKTPANFLTSTMGGPRTTFPTEIIELGSISRGREVAPYTGRDAEATLVGGHTRKYATLKFPNIRIKQAFRPTPLFFNRPPAVTIFPSGSGMIASAVREHIAMDIRGMKVMTENNIEVQWSQLLQGAISVSDMDSTFTATLPRASSLNITLTTFWDDADPDLPAMELDILAVKKLMSELDGLMPNVMILGTEADEAFLTVLKKQGGLMDKREMSFGQINLAAQFNEMGAMFHGVFAGLAVFSYPRQVTDSDGVTAINLIRPKYAELVHVGPGAERFTGFGVIPDMDALEGGQLQSEYFSKSWRLPDPSEQIALAHTRPLVWARRANSSASMKVVSG